MSYRDTNRYSGRPSYSGSWSDNEREVSDRVNERTGSDRRNNKSIMENERDIYMGWARQ